MRKRGREREREAARERKRGSERETGSVREVGSKTERERGRQCSAVVSAHAKWIRLTDLYDVYSHAKE